MTPEKLQQLKAAKAICFDNIKAIVKQINELKMKQSALESLLAEQKKGYERLDRQIAEQEHLTICEPSGLGAKKKFGILGLTKKQALAIIEGLDEDEDEEEEDE